MATVTITGGPFTDGKGNPIPGDWQFQPVSVVDALVDGAPHEVHGTLLFDAGTFSVVLPEGTYQFVLITEVEVYSGPVVVNATAGATQTIESLV